MYTYWGIKAREGCVIPLLVENTRWGTSHRRVST